MEAGDETATPEDMESKGEGSGSSESPIQESFSEIMDTKIQSMKAEARALNAKGWPQRAVTRLSRAIVLKPDDPELFSLRGEASVLAREYYTAIANFKKVIALGKADNEHVTKRLSAVYYQHGLDLVSKDRHEEAIESFWNCEKHDANNKEAVARRMECLIAMQKYSECMDVIEKEVQKDKTNPDLYVIRAQLNMLFGKATKGYMDVCKALEIRDTHTEAKEMKQDMEKKAREYKNEAIKKTLLGNRTGALTKLNNAIHMDPRVADYFILRGSILRCMGDFTFAVDDFLRAMDMCEHKQDSPVYCSALKQLLFTYNDFAMVCFRQRKFDCAISLLNKAIKQEKEEKGLYLNRGDCFYRLGHLEFALCDYQQALELDPGNWEVYCRLAVVYGEVGVELFRKRQYSRAEELFSAAIQHNPKVSHFYICRARARYQLKKIAGAKEDVLFSMLLNPDSDECVPLLARIFAGKSKEELLCTLEAVQAQHKLHASITHTANLISIKAKYRRRRDFDIRGDVLKRSPLKSALGLEELELKVEQEETIATSDHSSQDTFDMEKSLPQLSPQNLSVPGKTMAEVPPPSMLMTPSPARHQASILKLGPVKLGNEKGDSAKSGSGSGTRRSARRSGLTQPLSCPMTSAAVLGDSQEQGDGDQEEVLTPREWSVLSCPLPKIPSCSHGLLASIQDSFEETRFHKLIYYSKKQCDTELESRLRVPLQDYVAPLLPRIQNFHDLVIGGRSILTASSLIKSVKL